MAIFDFINQQNSVEWMKRRAGIPTASCFDQIMTPKTMKPSESRKKYAMRLIAERILRWQAMTLDKIDAIAAGKENEPFAVASLELVYGIETKPVGLVTTDDGRFGASPDRIAGIRPTSCDTVIEIKCPSPPIHLGYLIFEDDDGTYKCQRQGQLWVAEADHALFCSYHPRCPIKLVRDGRDEGFLAKLRDCLERFSDELEAWDAKARSLGAYEAFPAFETPAGAAYTTDEQIEIDINQTQFDWGA